MISPDNIIRPNGSRYSENRYDYTTVASPSPMQRGQGNASHAQKPSNPNAGAIQYNLNAQRLSQDIISSPNHHYTPTAISKLSQYVDGTKADPKQ